MPKSNASEAVLAKDDTVEVPTLLDLVTEWDSLEARIKFYTAGAESVAGDGTRHSCGDAMLRASDDLIEFVDQFEEMLNAYADAHKAEAAR
ncbi:hypothetical protein DLJ53_20720 [Acuticoccus sediminis]|uniref:Uncharacterized protein n=1 Tax=Acuticoccus sediminis TaxID=2184697 RepID=A0A8B2NKV6_9HYPH|nr:hypothetical protein [Acuticoccus sediminis]RAI00136.1 hypothetical protein DLJ53_20720 [Acuticoccus sediminis]